MGPLRGRLADESDLQEKKYWAAWDGISRGGCLCALITDEWGFLAICGWGEVAEVGLVEARVAIEVVGAAMIMLIAVWPLGLVRLRGTKPGVDDTVLPDWGLPGDARITVDAGEKNGGGGGRRTLRWFATDTATRSNCAEGVLCDMGVTMLLFKVRPRAEARLWFLGDFIAYGSAGLDRKRADTCLSAESQDARRKSFHEGRTRKGFSLERLGGLLFGSVNLVGGGDKRCIFLSD